MNPLVIELVNRGIDITLTKHDGEIVWDLNSDTKSGMYMSINETPPFTVTGRYGESDTVYDLEGLVYVFVGRYYARKDEAVFGNGAWIDLAVDLNTPNPQAETMISQS